MAVMDKHSETPEATERAEANGTAAETRSGAVPAFDVTRLCKDYRLESHTISVLKDVSFAVAEQEWVALVGRSGSGKTTLLHLLGNLDKPTAGTVACRGRDYADLSSRKSALLRRREIGFVFQSYHLFPELSALENVVLPALQWDADRSSMRHHARELLAGFGLEQRLGHRPQELSGGEQQRVALARALVNDPDIILADEPTGNLDTAASTDIMAILQRLHRTEGKTIVMVTHDLTLTEYADRVLTMQAGTVRES